ncbi:MAG TPA: hypothetical protein VMM60_09265 [Ilumatobacter sp.]|nr:hypothetical protein [Ilumatobacter sp.]
MSSRPTHTTLHPQLHPNAGMLRNRAATLRSFAETLEGLLVTQLPLGDEVDDFSVGDRTPTHLRHVLLQYNLQQLHRAADDLRVVAHQMWQDANGIELAHRVGSLPQQVG